MAKLLALDIGGKRTGMAESDPMQMMAFTLDTVQTTDLIGVLQSMALMKTYELLVVGLPRRLHGELGEAASIVEQVVEKIQKAFPNMPVHYVDERFTSSLAADALVRGGMKKSKRQEKGAVDKVAAALILENFLAQR
ncbi:MAG: hypothetical protein RL754_1203 [Bacteroidota bacterium]